jgi:hypothetical protein
MKVVILYKPISELASSVEAYAREFERETSHKLELIDVESKEGITLAEVHDVVRNPVMLALRDDHSLIEIWPERESWPTFSELSAYVEK